MKIQNIFMDHGTNVAENDTEEILWILFTLLSFLSISHCFFILTVFGNLLLRTEIKIISMACQNAVFKMIKYY